LKFTFKEQKEFEEIDGLIETIEGKLCKVRSEINNAGSDFLLLQDLSRKEEELQKELDEKIERWTYLNDLAERIEESKK
jgi:ATP-binding cassette subfamily F protein uup